MAGMFQFTRARGARHGVMHCSYHEYLFQFTRARGARQARARTGQAREVSIHARTGRATGDQRRLSSKQMFQFTRARGARPSARGPTATSARCFNSRAHGARDAVAR